jgi:hypothetical protein
LTKKVVGVFVRFSCAAVAGRHVGATNKVTNTVLHHFFTQ